MKKKFYYIEETLLTSKSMAELQRDRLEGHIHVEKVVIRPFFGYNIDPVTDSRVQKKHFSAFTQFSTRLFSLLGQVCFFTRTFQHFLNLDASCLKFLGYNYVMLVVMKSL